MTGSVEVIDPGLVVSPAVVSQAHGGVVSTVPASHGPAGPGVPDGQAPGAGRAATIVPLPGDLARDAVFGDFLRCVGRTSGRSTAVERALADAAAERSRGTCPVVVDALLHRVLAGMSESELRRAAREWYGGWRARQACVAAGLHDAAVGRPPVVLVSDVPAVCLRLLAADHGIAHVVGAEPATDGYGLLVGVNAAPVVGPARVRRVRQLLDELGVDPRSCTVLGRSSLDVDLLRLVGHPVVVGDNEYLRALAARSGWSAVRAGEPTDAVGPAARLVLG